MSTDKFADDKADDNDPPPTDGELAELLKQFGRVYTDVVMDFGDFAQIKQDKEFFELLVVFVCFKTQQTLQPDEKERVGLLLGIYSGIWRLIVMIRR